MSGLPINDLAKAIADPKPALAPTFKPHSRMQRTALIRNIHTK